MGALVNEKKEKNYVIDLHTNSLRLTFAGLNALKPPVSDVGVTGTPAVLEPRTTTSATTDYAGFLELAAF